MFILSSKNRSYSIVFGIFFIGLLSTKSIQSISRSILEEQNEAADITKLLEHARASLQSLETFTDGISSFELVVAQPEVVTAIKYNNAKNSSPSITKLNLPSKVLTICKEVCSSYKKNTEELKVHSERISDMLAIVGDLWPTAPMNELLKKQNLITWANEIYKKERVVVKPQKPVKVVEQVEVPKASSENKSQATANETLPITINDGFFQMVKNGVTRRKKGSLCSSCNSCNILSKALPTENRPSTKTVTRRNDYESRATSAEKAGHLPPWMQKQSSSNTLATQTTTIDNPTFAKPRRASGKRKNVEPSQKQDFVADPDALKSSKDQSGKSTVAPKSTKTSTPCDITGPVVR